MEVVETDAAWLERKRGVIQNEIGACLHVSRRASYGRLDIYKRWFAWSKISVYRNKVTTCRDYLEIAKRVADKLGIEKVIIVRKR